MYRNRLHLQLHIRIFFVRVHVVVYMKKKVTTAAMAAAETVKDEPAEQSVLVETPGASSDV